MALIKCPECKKKISDQSDNCPKCGYPIKTLQDENSKIESNESSINIPKENKPLYKKTIFWIVVGVVIVSLIIGLVVFLNRDTKPKFDKDGQPVFVDMTNEVYTNIDNYLGYHVKVKGKVFQVLGDTGTSKGIQIWLDPETSEQNMWIYYTNDVEIKKDDYIICSGYIDSNTSYSNTYGAELSAPLIISGDMQKSNYIDVMSPTIDTIIPEKLKYEQAGYCISVDKIEFSNYETRIYLTANNNGKATMFIDTDSSIIIQDKKQTNAKTNYEANYEEIPYNLAVGVTSSGIVSFPAIENKEFQYTIEIHSDNVDEEFVPVTFNIGKEKQSVQLPKVEKTEEAEEKTTVSTPPAKKYPSAVGTYYCYVSGYECAVYSYVYIYSDGTLYHEYIPEDETVSVDTPNRGTWTQSGSTICYNLYGVDGFVWNNPFYDTVYADGIDFLGEYYKRK